MYLRRFGFSVMVVAVPLLMGMHDSGCGANSATNPVVPESVDGCTLVFHPVSGDTDSFRDDLNYTFQSDGTVEGVGTGGTFYSKSYSYSAPVIFVDWGAATETITLLDHERFTYHGVDGPNVYDVEGTWRIAGSCAAYP